MRITADIIDEEPCLEFNTEPSQKMSKRHLAIVLREAKNGSEVPDKLVESMLKQFQKLSIRFVPNASKPRAGKEDSKKQALLSDYLMDSIKDLNESKKYEACCISYAEKMKDEIKREVIDEVLKILRENQPSTSSNPVSNKVVHPGIFCDHCDQQICGVRYKCGNCEDFDLCEECEKIPGIHSYRHVFLKLRYPFSLCMDAEESKAGTEACMVKNENGSYVFRPKSAPAKTPKETGFLRRTPEKPLEFNAKFIHDETIEDGEVITAGKPFLKKWRVANTGLMCWEKDVIVARLYGSDELVSETQSVTAPPLKPGEEGFVIVYFTAPKSEGNFACYWEFRHQGTPFGENLWCHIRVGLHAPKMLPFQLFEPAPNVTPKLSSSKAFFGDQMHCLMKTRRKAKEERKRRKESRKKEVRQIVDVLTAVQEEQGCRRHSSEALKPVVTSHTATPNNTPFDLSPPKSPEPSEFIEIKTDAIISYEDAGLPDLQDLENIEVNIGNECDEKQSINTVSSSESDSEFVVIPMPKCFSVLENLSVSQSSAPDIVSNLTNEEISAGAVAMSKQSPVKRSGSSEQVSQETGAPEEAENFNVNMEVQVKEMSVRRKEISTKTSFKLIQSPSSSSVSVIESEDNMSPTVPSAPPLVRAGRPELLLKFSTPTVPDHTVEPSILQDHGSQHQNITFPKFPLDTEDPPVYYAMSSSNSSANTESTSVSTPSPVHETERTIQVLPEGLVTGALIAAASVFNTAKAVISSVGSKASSTQLGSNAQDVSPHLSEVSSGATAAVNTQNSLQLLIEMGFCNRALNERLLREKKGDVAEVVAELVSMDDNDWYASRDVTTLD